MTLFHVEANEKSVCCSACGSHSLIRRGSKERWFRILPIGSRLTWVVAEIPRVQCRDCNVVRQIKIGFADTRRTYTKAWARYALELTRTMTIKDAADALGVTWDVVKEIKKTYLQKHFSKQPLKDVTHLAIDEICIGSGHRYLTIVIDWATGAVLFVGEGKSADTLVPFWRRLKRSRARIEAVAIDMSTAYISTVETHLPSGDRVRSLPCRQTDE